MIVSDILLLADINVPNNLQNGIKIMLLNEMCKQLYRDYPFPDEVYPFITEDGTAFYAFPDNCIEDQVNIVKVGSQTYTYRSQEELNLNYSWSVVADHLSLDPVPTQAMMGYIYYKPQPTDYTEDNLDNEPMFPEDFREALVFGLSKRIAMALPDPDYKKASYYSGEMDATVEMARRKLRKPRKRVGIYRSWR
jgi:hypothetical protein